MMLQLHAGLYKGDHVHFRGSELNSSKVTCYYAHFQIVTFHPRLAEQHHVNGRAELRR